MKILFIAQNAPPLQSGRARQALALRKELIDRGHSVDFWSIDTVPAATAVDSPVSVRLPQTARLSNTVKVLRHALQGRFDAVHFHGHHYLVALTPILRRAGIRCVLNMSEIGFDDPDALLNQPWLSRIQRAGIDNLHSWVVQNPSNAEGHAAAVCVPNAVTVPASVTPWAKRQQVILSSGVVCERKGQLELIEGFSRSACNVRENWQLILCGSYQPDFEEHDPAYVRAVLEAIRKVPGVRLLGHLQREELQQWLARSRYFTATSAREGLSNAYLEALAYGVQPILPADREDELFHTLNLTQSALRLTADGRVPELPHRPRIDVQALSDRVRQTFGREAVLPALEELYAGEENTGAMQTLEVAC